MTGTKLKTILNYSQAARLVNRHRCTIKRLVDEGLIPRAKCPLNLPSVYKEDIVRLWGLIDEIKNDGSLKTPITYTEAAEMINKSRSRVMVYANEGVIPKVKSPGNRLPGVYKEDVIRLYALETSLVNG